MQKVRTVLPATREILQDAGPHWPLGPMDHLVHPWIPVAVVFVYKHSLSLFRIHRALELLLDSYPQLAGRLDMQTKPGIDLSSARAGESGAHLLEAVCESTLEQCSTDNEVDLAKLPQGGNALLAPYAFDSDFMKEVPVLSVQHTSFACRGSVLGIRVLHTICGANGFFQLTAHLAELYRKLGQQADDLASLDNPPSVRPYLAEWAPTAEELERARQYKPSLFKLAPEVQDHQSAAADPPAPTDRVMITGRRIALSAARVAAMKEEASAGLPDGEWVSTFDSICANVAMIVRLARLAYYGSIGVPVLSSSFLTPINYADANRLPALPKGYFGNALFCAIRDLPYGSMPREQDLSRLAAAVHNLVQKEMPTSQELEATVRWIASQPDPSRIQTHFEPGNGSLMLSSWAKMDMYRTMDMGHGTPALVAPPFTPISLIDGLGYILPQAGQQRGLDIYLALDDRLWQELLRLVERS